MRLARALSSWKTAVVWMAAALATALAVSSISAADERDRLLDQNDRAVRTVEIGTERRLEIARLLDRTRSQLVDLELDLVDAQAQRAELLEEVSRLRVELARAEARR